MKEEIEKKVAYCFTDPTLIECAFTHRSYSNEHPDQNRGHNERLEFLGDAVLDLIVSEYLYLRFPSIDEGELSKLRAQIVSASACAKRSIQLGIEGYLHLGKGEQLNKGKGRESILADLFEALLGAIYLDGGYLATKQVFLSLFSSELELAALKPDRNWKAELQDVAQKHFKDTPIYEIVTEEGPAHKREFVVAVYIHGEQKGLGRGHSKKEAQVEAAKQALGELSW